MTIQVRVLSAKAQAQMKALQAQTAGLEAASARSARVSPVGPRNSASLVKWGNQLQWTGRQIQYNFTLPLALAAGAAAKWELDNQKAFTHVAKVYGDTQAAAAQFRKEDKRLSQQMAEQKATKIFRNELNALGDAFEAISNHYGVARKGVLEVAGAWAAAGASGKALAQSVDLTMQAVIIGDMDATKATEALISIQAQYNLSSGQLADTLASLNAIENQTGVDMKGLIDGFQRAAGVAREAGVSTRQLGALIAALVPATGSAANAGNALKTIFSRLMAPTKESIQVMQEMGLNIKSTAWQSSTAVDRLKMMQGAFEKLSPAARNAASSVIASRWQINKFNVLMHELGPGMSYYEKALQATSSRGKAFAQMQKELNTVLESNPQRLKQIWVILQNAMADVIQPMIPYLVYFANEIKNLMVSFSNLDPSIQKFILLSLAMFAIIGPVMRYIGSTTTLLASLGKGFRSVAGHLGFLGGTFKSFDGETKVARLNLIKFIKTLTITPFVMFGSAVMTVFGALAGGIQTAMAVAMTGVVRVVTAATPVVVGSINGIFRAVQLGTLIPMMLAPFKALPLLILGPLAAMAGTIAGTLETISLFSYQWGLGLVDGFKNIVLRVGVYLTLLPMYAMEAMKSLWAILTVQGAFTTALTAGWVRLTRIIEVVWVGLQVTLAAITTAGQRVIAASTLRGGAGIVGAWTALRGLIVRSWEGTLAFLASPSKLMGVFTRIGGVLLRVGPWLVRILTGPWGLAISAITGLLYIFRKQIAQIWNNIVSYVKNNANLAGFFNGMVNAIIKVFNKLPAGVQNAMVAVARIVHDVAMQVYQWFSYINPFAHHSPSLVENVTKGMATVVKQFSTLGGIKKYTTAAYAEIKRFGAMTAKLNLSAAKVQQSKDRKTIGGVSKAALGSYDRLTGLLNKLTPIMGKLKDQMDAQQRVVAAWQTKLDAAQNTLQGYQNKLDAAQTKLQNFASAPIKGMQAMDDEIFANTMQQNKLNLALMKMGDSVGTLDSIKSKMDAINGAQELLRGEKGDLIAAGAGSDITGAYDTQIKALDQTKSSYTANLTAMQDMQDQLDALQHQADEMNLEKSLKFDVLTHQIEEAANMTKELSFTDIMAGINGAKNEINKYTPAVNAAQAAVDSLQASYDKENAKLTAITDKYNQVNDAIQAINDSIGQVTSNAQSMHDALDKTGGASKHLKHIKKPKKGSAGSPPYISPGLQNLRDAKNGNFPDPGGSGLGIRTNWNDQSAGIKDFTKNLSGSTADMFKGLDPFGPLKKKWKEVKDWLIPHAKDTWKGIKDAASAIFSGVGNPFSGMVEPAKHAFAGITSAARSFGKLLRKFWALLGPDIIKYFKQMWAGAKEMWKQIGPQLAQFKDLIKPLGKALQNMWAIAKPILLLLAVSFLAVAKVVISVMADTIKPILKMIGGFIAGWVQFIRGFLEIIIGILSLNFPMVLKGFKDIFAGTFKAVWAIIKGFVQIILSVVKGFVRGVVNFVKWMADVLVGHSIIPDMVKAILAWFHILADIVKWLWNHLVMPVVNTFKKLWSLVKASLKLWWSGVKAIWNSLKKLGTWVWDNVLNPVLLKVKSLWKNHVKPALGAWWSGVKAEWAFLKKLGAWVWTNVLNPVLLKVKSLWTSHVKPALGAWWGGIKAEWHALTGLASWVKTNVLDRVANVFSKFLGKGGTVRTAFRNAVDAIGSIWHEIQSLAAKPVRFLVDTVYNEGIRKAVNLIPGVHNLKPAHANFKKGGVLPGYTPGKDVHTYHSATGPDLHLSGGEAIMRPEWTKAVGGAKAVAVMNRNARKGIYHFAGGGIFRPTAGGGFGGVHDQSTGYPAVDVHVGTGTPVHAAASGRVTRSYDIRGYEPRRSGPQDGYRSYGRVIYINHGGFSSLYAHLNSRGVGAGAHVRGGQLIARSGNTGNTTGPHLHFGARGASPVSIMHGSTNYAGKGGSMGGAKGGGVGGWISKMVSHVNPLKFLKLADWKKKLGGMGAWGGMIKNTAGTVVGQAKDWMVNKIKGAYKGVKGLLSGGDTFTSTIRSFLGGGISGAAEAVGQSAAKSYARAHLKDYGWGANQWAPLNQLWTRESGWRVHADNPTSSAYGIPQALPGSKMASAGKDWHDNAGTQIKWGLGYIKGRYGSPSTAWRHETSVGWYKNGGVWPGVGSLPALREGGIIRARAGGVLARIGEGGQDEAVTPLPRGWRGQAMSIREPVKKTELHFHGDLSFPNITDPNDAATFIENLENLAKD